MFRATGRGTFRNDPRAHASGNLEWIHLDNFDVDGVTLKVEHRNLLTERFGNNFLPTTHTGDLLIPADDIWIFLRGYASRTGGRDHEEHNMALSLERVAVVSNYLNSIGISDGHITGLDYVGEAWSHGEIEEDDNFRSVEVIARSENRPPPPARPAFIYDRFRMRAKTAGPDIIGAIAGEFDIPIGSTVLMIEIQNRTTSEIRTFLFVSLQASAGLSVPLPDGPSGSPRDLPASHSDYGDWVNFRTRSHHHVNFSEFEGSASFGSMVGVQIGSYSPGESLGMGENYFQFDSDRLHNVDNWVTVLPRTIVLPLPPTSGIGFSLISMSAFGRLRAWH